MIWLLPIGASILVPLVSLVGGERACKWFATLASALTLGVATYQAFTFNHAYVETIGSWFFIPTTNVSLQVQVDSLSVLISSFVAFLSFVIVIYAVENMKLEKGQTKFYSLVLLFIGAMLGLVMAGNLIQFYFFWEIVGICSALLIAFWNEKEEARKAGFKAFVVTRFGDIALLIAVVLTLTTFGTTSFTSISSNVHAFGVDPMWFLIGALAIVGAMGKSAQVPLHVWLPDAMEGPTSVSALIHAATMVNAGVFLLVRLSPIYGASALLSGAILVIGLTSMIVGAASACAEQDLKRILAYSTISQLGLMFAAVGLGNFSGAIYQLIGQGIFKALAFMAAGSVIEAIGTRNIEDMGGLRRAMKYTYIAFLFAMLSMVGLPPLLGFWTKDSILSGALSTNVYAFLTITLASVLTSLYGFRALFKAFYGQKKMDANEAQPLMVAPMLALIISVLTGWVILNYQRIFLPSLSVSITPFAFSATIIALVAGLALAYLGFLSNPSGAKKLVESTPLLNYTVKFLSEGFEFDKAYDILEESIVRPLVRGVKALQSGILGNNIALLLSALVVLIVLIAAGVL